MGEAAALRPGRPYPLGATLHEDGVNFALFSQHAEAVELCLFDASGRHELRRIALPECTDGVWHGHLAGATAGVVYGYRVHGPYRPHDGHRFNPHKLLLDPYARQLVGALHWSDALYGYEAGHVREDLSFDTRDSAPCVPKCRVVESAFDWGEDAPPATPWRDTLIYEAHVRGLTMRHPQVPPPLRGTYAGLASAPVIEHLRRLGVTALELLPVHAVLHERRLVESGRVNYWGYNPLAFCAPEPRYAAGADPVTEFKAMVKALHAAGIEVILDVVYNHTGEGDRLGPTVCWRGIDNAAYYRLREADRRDYVDFTGCGNTLNVAHPRVLQSVLDSLRAWVTEFHVDGFRFDLATALARGAHGFEPAGAFLAAVAQDPVLARVKLIAEPWDLGADGHRLGRFPPGWAEWNDRYRDAMRAFWRGDAGLAGEFARRLTGSADLFAHAGRRPQAAVNYVTAHDGFTLRDLVSYERKHNEANGEDNRDGHDNNLSCNYGVEGPTDDARINRLRAQQQRNLIATLLLSQGVPMILGGDEIGRTQRGNNNAYCQDDETSWLDWALDAEREGLLAFVCWVAALRRAHPSLRRRAFLRDGDIAWRRPDGAPMTTSDWEAPATRALAVWLAGADLRERGPRGETLCDDDLLLLINAHSEPRDFCLPAVSGGRAWRVEFDTARDDGLRSVPVAGDAYRLAARALALLVAAPEVERRDG
jgi:glycogen operon protein